MIRSLLIASVFGFASIASAADKPEEVIGTKAPAPTLPGLDGKPVKFDSLRGKAATVVVFVSFECPVSNSYATQLNELAKATQRRASPSYSCAPVKIHRRPWPRLRRRRSSPSCRYFSTRRRSSPRG